MEKKLKQNKKNNGIPFLPTKKILTRQSFRLLVCHLMLRGMEQLVLKGIYIFFKYVSK